jgi:hypothetical protein
MTAKLQCSTRRKRPWQARCSSSPTLKWRCSCSWRPWGARAPVPVPTTSRAARHQLPLRRSSTQTETEAGGGPTVVTDLRRPDLGTHVVRRCSTTSTAPAHPPQRPSCRHPWALRPPAWLPSLVPTSRSNFLLHHHPPASRGLQWIRLEGKKVKK